MPWIYDQSSGKLYYQKIGEKELDFVAIGYSGHGIGVNNLSLEWKKNVGPIPRGEYKIGRPYKHKNLGPMVSNLDPVRHEAHGRTAFRIHGDNGKGDQSASEGCIILGPSIRNKISNSGDDVLIVQQ